MTVLEPWASWTALSIHLLPFLRQELPDGSTVRTAGHAALGQLQLSPLQALQRHFPDPPCKEEKGTRGTGPLLCSVEQW